jgi:glutamyl-tRNA synthetase
MNGTYIRNMKRETLYAKVQEYIGDSYDKAIVAKSIPLVQERLKKFSDYLPLTEFLFQKPSTYEVDLAKYKEILHTVSQSLSSLTDFTALTIGDAMVRVAQASGLKNSEFFQMLRVAISGKKVSPPLNESMEILGKEECIRRVQAAC